MTLFILALLCISPIVAAPVPKEDDAARMRRIYGAVVDPDEDCRFEILGDKLQITIPGTFHSLTSPFIRPQALNAPRVWKEVKGNFTATLRVSFRLRAAPEQEVVLEAGGPTFGPPSGGGLVVWDGADNFSVASRDERPANGEAAGVFCFERHSPKGSQAAARHLTPGDSAYLRITRAGQKAVAEYSEDGKKWRELHTVEVAWGETVKVGVFAHTRNKKGFMATFDEYTLTTPKK
jgi:hypothetical protein